MEAEVEGDYRTAASGRQRTVARANANLLSAWVWIRISVPPLNPANRAFRCERRRNLPMHSHWLQPNCSSWPRAIHK